MKLEPEPTKYRYDDAIKAADRRHRKWAAAVAAMQGLLASGNSYGGYSLDMPRITRLALEQAELLVKGFEEEEKK